MIVQRSIASMMTRPDIERRAMDFQQSAARPAGHSHPDAP